MQKFIVFECNAKSFSIAILVLLFLLVAVFGQTNVSFFAYNLWFFAKSERDKYQTCFLEHTWTCFRWNFFECCSKLEWRVLIQYVCWTKANFRNQLACHSCLAVVFKTLVSIMNCAVKSHLQLFTTVITVIRVICSCFHFYIYFYVFIFTYLASFYLIQLSRHPTTA